MGFTRAATPGAMALPLLENMYFLTDVRLGGGADGRVCRGIVRPGQPGAGSRHAVKIFRDDAYNPDREIEVLRKLQPHPHILELHGLFASGRRQAMVTAEMDFDLHVFLSRRQTGLSLPATTSFCGQLLRALAYMHHHRIVHGI